VKERPILFSGSMVNAIREGRKTQTRRVVRPQPEPMSPFAPAALPGDWTWHRGGCSYTVSNSPHGPADIADDCPYGVPGDRLWVREKWRPHWTEELGACICYVDGSLRKPRGLTEYQGHRFMDMIGDYDENNPSPWRPSIHMPRWACRLVLEVVSVRVERVQEITSDDAGAEGVGSAIWESCRWKHPIGVWPDGEGRSVERSNFASLWQEINGNGSWAVNPWVWVIEFKKVS